MLTYISSAVTILVCFISWLLVRANIQSDLKRQEQSKINKLIFNLLRLKYWIDKEVSQDKQLAKVLDVYQKKVAEQDHRITEADFDEIKNKIRLVFKQHFSNNDLSSIEETIEAIIADLAEINPVLAYDFTDKYRITNYVNRLKSMIGSIDADDSNTDFSQFMINDLLRPRMLTDLQADLQIQLPQIAKRSDKHTYEQIKKLSSSKDNIADITLINKVIDDIIPQLFEKGKISRD